MTEHETTASLRRAALLRWWTILWAGALWITAAVLLVSVAFGCSAGETGDGQTDGGQTDDGGAEAEAGEAAEPPATTRPEAEAAPDNAPPRTPWTIPPDDPARCAEAQAEAEALAPAALDGYDGDETTLASAEWWELAHAVNRAIVGGGPGCSHEEGSAADAVADLRLRESEAVETARLEALEARRAEDADDQAAAEAAVEQAWQEAGGGALSGGAGALSEPDQGETRDPGAGPEAPNPDRPGCETEANPVSCQPPPDPPAPTVGEPEPPTGTLVFEDTGPEIPDGQTADPQAAGPVVLGGAAVLSTWTEHLCPPEGVLTGGGFVDCAAWIANWPITLSGCYHAPARLGVGDRYISTSPLVVYPQVLDDGTIGHRLERSGEILGFSAPDVSAGGMWAWVTPRVREAQTYLYEMTTGEVEREALPGSPFTAPTLPWMQIGGEAGRTLAADGTLASGLLAVDPETPPDAPSPC